MGDKSTIKKKKENIIIDPSRKKLLLEFLQKLNKLKSSERLKYFNSISQDEVKLLSELAVNFLQSNLVVDYRSYKLLHRVKKYVRDLASKLTSYKIKKKLLQTVQGLNIVNVLIHVGITTLQ